MKHTAVEWLEAIIKHCERFGTNVEQKDIEQAKQIEKEQMMNAWYNGFEENRPYVDHSEDYYNKTYKQQDNEK